MIADTIASGDPLPRAADDAGVRHAPGDARASRHGELRAPTADRSGRGDLPERSPGQWRLYGMAIREISRLLRLQRMGSAVVETPGSRLGADARCDQGRRSSERLAACSMGLASGDLRASLSSPRITGSTDRHVPQGCVGIEWPTQKSGQPRMVAADRRGHARDVRLRRHASMQIARLAHARSDALLASVTFHRWCAESAGVQQNLDLFG